MQFFRDIRYETKWLIEELIIKIKHPTRKGEASYHAWKLYRTIIGHPWYCLKRGIRNLWVWFPLIWRNDVFDHQYLMNLMDKQLSEMEDFWKSDYPNVRAQPHIRKRITWTRKLMSMTIDEHYSMKYFYHFHSIRGGFKEWQSVACAWDEYGIPTMFESIETMSEEDKAEYRAGSAKAHEMDKKVWKLFIKNMSRMREWWD